MQTTEQTIANLRRALGTLVNEAKHYRNTGKGRVFLDEAIKEADLTLDAIPRKQTEAASV